MWPHLFLTCCLNGMCSLTYRTKLIYNILKLVSQNTDMIAGGASLCSKSVVIATQAADSRNKSACPVNRLTEYRQVQVKTNIFSCGVSPSLTYLSKMYLSDELLCFPNRSACKGYSLSKQVSPCLPITFHSAIVTGTATFTCSYIRCKFIGTTSLCCVFARLAPASTALVDIIHM